VSRDEVVLRSFQDLFRYLGVGSLEELAFLVRLGREAERVDFSVLEAIRVERDELDGRLIDVALHPEWRT
jgi:hypothetical protein